MSENELMQQAIKELSEIASKKEYKDLQFFVATFGKDEFLTSSTVDISFVKLCVDGLAKRKVN